MASGTDRAGVYVAGSSSAVPRPGRANSGYLLRTGDCSIALDFGSGVFSRVREQIDPRALDAVVISHMHADHFFDLVPLRYALRYELQRRAPLPVYLPPGGRAVLEAVAGPLKETDDFYGDVFDLREYAPEQTLRIGSCTVRFAKTIHYVDAYAIRVQTAHAVLGYSADTAPCDRVAELMAGADIFLCEAGLGATGSENGSQRGHLNAREAGELATQAGVKRLVLTHYGTYATPQQLQEAAHSAYAGPITVADDGMEIAL